MKCVRKENPKSSFDPRSIRTVKRGAVRILVGCPKGQWNARGEKGAQCRVGLRAYEVIKPAKGGRCRVGETKKR